MDMSHDHQQACAAHEAPAEPAFEAPAPAAPVPVPRDVLVVGHAEDAAEADADRRAATALQRLARAGTSKWQGGGETHQHTHAGGHLRRTPAPAASAGDGVGYAGGVLGRGTSDAINSKRGGGRPLDGPVLDRMQTAFSADFSRVRIHDDGDSSQLNRLVSARAFTTGKDIFFGAGEYAPDTAAGEQVLAHELAHTLQGSAAADVRPDPADAGLRRQPDDGVIRRAVGFEFQCRNWKVQDTKGDKVESGKGKDQRLYPETEPKGWYLMSDGGDPEFVIDHVDTDDSVTLGKVVKAVAKFADDMAKARGNTRIMTKGKHGGKAMVDLVPGDRPVTADPQVTAGIALGRIDELFDQLSQRDIKDDSKSSEANKQLMRNKQVKHYRGDDLLLGKARTAVQKQLQLGYVDRLLTGQQIPAMSTDRDEVVGVLALLTSYLMKAKELGHSYIKDFPVLSKTDLGEVVKSSPLARNSKPRRGVTQRQEDGELTYEDSPLREWSPESLEMVVQLLMRAGGRTDGEELLYGGEPTGKPDDDGPTVHGWLDSLIQQHRDLLSHRKNRDFADNSMGNLGHLDTVGRGSKSAAPIVELRRINETLPSDQWADFVERVRFWLDQLNDVDQYPSDLK